MKNVGNIICVVIGLICFALGTLGVILPVLPTTPFYVAAACLFAKGSNRFHRWFINTKLYQKHIESVVTKKEMSKRAKVKFLVTISILFTIGILICPIWHAQAAIAVIWICHIYYFTFKVKSIKETV